MVKKVVVPGELISAERKKLGSNVYVANGKIYAKVLGVNDDEDDNASVVALEGKYLPRRDDVIIGVVTRVVMAGYGVNLNSAADSFIPAKAVRDQLKLGDVVMAKIEDVNELREAELAYPRRLMGGEVIEIIPVRSPRLIGKSGSMLELLRKGTGCELVVGKNGRIWAKNGNMDLLKKVITFIEENAYKSNLTNALQDYFGITISEKPAVLEESEVLAPKGMGEQKSTMREESEVLNYDNEGGKNE